MFFSATWLSACTSPDRGLLSSSLYPGGARLSSVSYIKGYSYSTPSLFCRRLRLISHPTSCQLERDNFLEIMQCFEHLLQGHLLLCAALPHCLIQCSNHQVIVAHDCWVLLHEASSTKRLRIKPTQIAINRFKSHFHFRLVKREESVKIR